MAQEQKRRRGYIYVLSNPSMPGIVKVGRTFREPRARAAELSASTGVPTPFKIEATVYTWRLQVMDGFKGCRETSPSGEFMHR
jgi:hypothetical protein